jgi:Arm DNA-binding domain
MNELSDTKIRNAKPADKEYTLADGQGLSVRVQMNGTKIWLYLYRYRFGGKRKNMSFGVFPAVTLKMAREKRHDAESCSTNGRTRRSCARPSARRNRRPSTPFAPSGRNG